MKEHMDHFQMRVGANHHDVILMINRCEGTFQFLSESGHNDHDLDLVWETQFPSPDVRITLRPDGTWVADMIVTVGEDE